MAAVGRESSASPKSAGEKRAFDSSNPSISRGYCLNQVGVFGAFNAGHLSNRR
jgi:hypothetical protein